LVSILIVDDDPTLLKMIEIYLSDFPAKLKLVRNGRVALKFLETSDFDLMLTDLQMPEVDGYDLIQRLREDGNRMPIIILSAFGMEKMAEKALALGANQMLTKPFDGGALRRVIKDQLNIT
jgi:DNA-binding response OmpR family regulator